MLACEVAEVLERDADREHVEHAYALTGHGMQGATVERAFVVAFPHGLTRGWSYTALSRAREQTRLFVMTDSEERDRDELAPGERQGKPTEKDIYARLHRYMQTRDDEDLAIEQLPAPPPTVELDRDAGRDLERAVAVNARSTRLLDPRTTGRPGPH